MDNAQAVIYRGTLYVGGGGTRCNDFILCAYNFEADTWSAFTTKTRFYALAVYWDRLVLAGGCLPRSYLTPTNQVELWLTSDQQDSFKRTMAPMIAPTYYATAITTQNHLIIAGGLSGTEPIDIVQICDGTHWAQAQPLPRPSSFMKHTIHGDSLYLIGGYKQGDQVFYASLPSLLQSRQR